MSGVATAVVVGAAVVGSNIYAANKQESAAKSAANAQTEAAKNEYAQQEQQYNRQNQDPVDTTALLEANSSSSSNGADATVLTGSEGVSKNQMNLGSSSLVGNNSSTTGTRSSLGDSVDLESLLTSQAAMESGASNSTMQTGPLGVKKKQMNLGKSTLLGG